MEVDWATGSISIWETPEQIDPSHLNTYTTEYKLYVFQLLVGLTHSSRVL